MTAAAPAASARAGWSHNQAVANARARSSWLRTVQPAARRGHLFEQHFSYAEPRRQRRIGLSVRICRHVSQPLSAKTCATASQLLIRLPEASTRAKRCGLQRHAVMQPLRYPMKTPQAGPNLSGVRASGRCGVACRAASQTSYRTIDENRFGIGRRHGLHPPLQRSQHGQVKPAPCPDRQK
jgi:hypothetical protein